MKDRFAPFASYLPTGTWPYWMPNLPIGASTPPGDPWPQGSPSLKVSGGLFGNFAQPAGGLLGNALGAVEDTATTPWNAINGPTAWAPTTMPSVFLPAPSQNGWTQDRPSPQASPGANFQYPAAPAYASDQLNPWDNNRGVASPNAPERPPTKPNVPFYGPGDVLLPPPEPAPSPPPKDFRTWLRDALSDENTRYYFGPHFFDALQKLHVLTQLLPGSGTVQSTQDASRATEEARAGNYGRAAAHLGMGSVNAALDWLPPAKLAILGGTMATTFPWNRLPTAMGMEAAGRSTDEIWRATGLERDAAGHWIFEIPDKGFRIHPNAGDRTVWRPITVAPLYEHYTHPGMKQAYPQLRNWPSMLSIEPGQRKFGEMTGEQVIVRGPDLRSAKLGGIHELQHLIGLIEKHPPGGVPAQFRGPGVSQQEAYDRYMRLIGEVVARNAQYRLLMSDRQRRLRSPQSTESVPRDQQINLYDE